jgi:hypothetical protein
MPQPNTITIDKTEYVRKDSVKTMTYKPSKAGPWKIGTQYFLRTVTHAHVGTVVEVTANEIVLMDASWIADTKRFSQFVHGTPEDGIEVEPFPRNKPVIIGRGGLIDAVELPGDFGAQK